MFINFKVFFISMLMSLFLIFLLNAEAEVE